MEVVVVFQYGKTRLNVTEVDGAEWRFSKFMLYEGTGKIAQKTFSENATVLLLVLLEYQAPKPKIQIHRGQQAHKIKTDFTFSPMILCLRPTET